MQQEVRFIHSVQSVDHLLIIAGAQCGYNQTLCFASGEQGRTVGSGQQASLTTDRSHCVQSPAINSLAVFHNIAA